MDKYLITLVGPTAVGKTDTAIQISKILNTPVISCDSRQFYRELIIGTAPPSHSQLNQARHYFIGHKSIFDYYNVNMFEADVLRLLEEIFRTSDYALMTGGSGLYYDTVCRGIDDIPDIDFEVREQLALRLDNEGIESMRFELKRLDPVYYSEVDLRNKKRILRAIEVCISTGMPFSSFRTRNSKTRDFIIIKTGLTLEKDELYEKINSRVDKMIDAGLVEEARKFYEHRNINTLNTVGYKEIFEFFDGKISMEKAVELIKRNTRHYAKRQMTWFLRDKEITWFHPSETGKIIEFINESTGKQL